MVTLLVLSLFVVILIAFFGAGLKPGWRLAIAAIAFFLVNIPTILYWAIGDNTTAEVQSAARDEKQASKAAQ